jgi:hypothetical protein
MGVISGYDGYVNGKKQIRNWTISSRADLQAMLASNTDGAPIQVAGNKDWTGSYGAYGHTPEAKPGDTFKFQGVIEDTTDKGIESAASGTIVESVEINWDQATAAVIAHTVNFAANGALTRGALSGVTKDSDAPTVFISSGCKVERATPAGSPSFNELLNVLNVTLNISRENKPYVTSTTGVQTERAKGNLIATVSIAVLCSDFADLPEENDMEYVRLYVDDSTYWDIRGIRWGEASDMSVNVETGDLVGATLNGTFSGFADIASVWTKGYLKDPGSADWWPPA